MAESNGSLLLGIWRDSLHVTCGLTACTPGSAPGPKLGNEYGKTLPLPRSVYAQIRIESRRVLKCCYLCDETKSFEIFFFKRESKIFKTT